MPIARVNGVELYYEETGQGFPLVWNHELAGDYRSWEPQVRSFSRRYRVVTYNYRGYPPSSVPTEPAAYANETLVEDLAALLRHLGGARAHVGGLSTGGYVTLNFGIAHPAMAASLIVCACGSGTVGREAFLMKRHIPHAGLLMLPMSGHTTTIEEPGAFNLHVAEFLAAVAQGRWGTWKA